MPHASGATPCGRNGARVRDDIRAVMATAQALGVSEYQLFERAWASQFGDMSAGDDIPEAYAGYLFRAEIPDWVSRHVLLNRAAVRGLGVSSPAPARRSTARICGPVFVLAVAGAAILVGFLLKLAVI